MRGPAAIERVRFAQGQRLPAVDLDDALASALRLQQLHVVAAHRTWGAAIGLRVIAGTTGVAIFPGVAYDALGRAIVVTGIARVPLPTELASEPQLDFVVAFADGRRPLPRFVLPADVRPGLDVPLARFALDQGKLGQADLTVRKGASSAGAPRIAGGLVSLTVTVASPYFRYSAVVDTSVAGFQTTPSYVITPNVGAMSQPANVPALGPFVAIRAASSKAFRLEVRFGRLQAGGAAGITASFPLDVTWLGVEPSPRSEPVSFTSG